MRIRSTLAALLLTTALAHAQAVSPLGGSTNNAGSPPPALSGAATTPPSAPAATRATQPRRTLDERFAAANTTHDGKLTLDQAKAGRLRAVSRDFVSIDKSKRGYVTLDEIKAYQADQRAARRAARDAKK
ncbi:MAG: hypothetical protein RQ966_07015 [Acetobacteraceae bacterium]|nr:hypothetical protein [Acetobacteraceae bacterium]